MNHQREYGCICDEPHSVNSVRVGFAVPDEDATIQLARA